MITTGIGPFVKCPHPEMIEAIAIAGFDFAVVDMDQYFNVSGADNTTGYFDIIVKYNNKIANDYARCRVHTTTVKTIYLPN